MTKSIWEAEGRARKCAALCRAIDRDLVSELGQIPDDATARYLRAQPDAWWDEIAKRHGINKPSAATIEAVCLEFEARAEEAELAEVMT